MVGAAPLVVAALAGADTVLLACATAYAYARLFAHPKVATINELKGKRIGLARLGTIDDGILRYALNERGLNAQRDVVFLAAGSGAERVGFKELLDFNKAALYNPRAASAAPKPMSRIIAT
jgi:ABC-type nitrate/sulfonate/bicarbonate transport system substrate-binding protein